MADLLPSSKASFCGKFICMYCLVKHSLDYYQNTVCLNGCDGGWENVARDEGSQEFWGGVGGGHFVIGGNAKFLKSL